jgi:hypothetical protein
MDEDAAAILNNTALVAPSQEELRDIALLEPSMKQSKRVEKPKPKLIES